MTALLAKAELGGNRDDVRRCLDFRFVGAPRGHATPDQTIAR
jgi:hypothetical protein